MAFIQYSPLIMTSWTVVREGQKRSVGVIAALEMLIRTQGVGKCHSGC